MDVTNVVIARQKNDEQTIALKAFMKALKINFEIKSEKPYNPKFLEKNRQSEDDFKAGKFTRVKAEDLNEFIDRL